MRGIRFVIATLFAAGSSNVLACDMDGLYGHRFSAFAGMLNGAGTSQSSDSRTSSDSGAPDYRTSDSYSQDPTPVDYNSQPATNDQASAIRSNEPTGFEGDVAQRMMR